MNAVVNLFTEEERFYINRFYGECDGDVNRLLSCLSFLLDCPSDATVRELQKDILLGLISKLENLNKDEWDELKNYIPLQGGLFDDELNV